MQKNPSILFKHFLPLPPLFAPTLPLNISQTKDKSINISFAGESQQSVVILILMLILLLKKLLMKLPSKLMLLKLGVEEKEMLVGVPKTVVNVHMQRTERVLGKSSNSKVKVVI